jgi:hypothetical protein
MAGDMKATPGLDIDAGAEWPGDQKKVPNL